MNGDDEFSDCRQSPHSTRDSITGWPRRVKGFEVRTAVVALPPWVALRRSPTDILVARLQMPNMSGFELISIVRRRFLHFSVIAISGESTGLIANHFFSKGSYYRPDQFFTRLR